MQNVWIIIYLLFYVIDKLRSMNWCVLYTFAVVHEIVNFCNCRWRRITPINL